MAEPQWCLDEDGDNHSSYCIYECSPPDGEPGWVAYATILGEDCDDADADIYFGAPELCDGVDNDCNGLEDDDVQGVGEACGVGVCSGGRMECNGLGLVCSTDSLISAETCDDGLDNDCDGLTDSADSDCQ